jgi:hypothetical protein
LQAQVATGHIGRLREAQDAEDRGGDIAQGTVGAQLNVGFTAGQDEWNWVGGVIRVRASRFWIDHHFGVAVVGGDEPSGLAVQSFERPRKTA